MRECLYDCEAFAMCACVEIGEGSPDPPRNFGRLCEQGNQASAAMGRSHQSGQMHAVTSSDERRRAFPQDVNRGVGMTEVSTIQRK